MKNVDIKKLKTKNFVDLKNKNIKNNKEYTLSLNAVRDVNFLNDKDPIYKSIWFAKFLNNTLIAEGKKEKGELILYKALKTLKLVYLGKKPLPIIFESAEKMKSAIETRPIRLGGNTIHVPMYIIGARRIKTTLLRFRQAFWKRSEPKAVDRVVREICLIMNNSKDSYLVQMENKSWDVIYNNRSYIHYRWY